MANIDDIQAALFRAKGKLLNDRIKLASNPSDPDYQRYVQEDLAAIASLEAQLADAVQVGGGAASAGNLARDDQLATVPGSLPQSPDSVQQVLTPDGRIATVPDTTSGTTAISSENTTTAAGTPTTVDTGTNAPVRPLQETQATPYGPGLLLNPGDVEAQAGGYYGGVGPAAPIVSTQIGFGANGDDTGLAKNSTKTEVDNVFNQTVISPQPNVLDQYASYTYQASVYLMSAEAYKTMCDTQQKNLQGCDLLFQSGGAPVTGRNEYFTNDYYIDKITLESVISGKGTNQAHNVNQIKMTVIEPNGITLINNMDKALNAKLGPEAKKKNFNAQQYLLIIRFYGYDQAGNLVQANKPSPYGFTDPAAFVEKVIDTPTETAVIWKKPVVKFVPLVHWAMFPTIFAAAEAYRTVLPAPAEASPVKLYCGEFCWL